MRPSCAFISRPFEGVGNAGCPLHPQPRVRSVESTRVFTTSSPEHPAFPHAMVLTAYFALSPVTGLFCHRRLADISARLDAGVEASGPPDCAVRFSASRQKPIRVHRIPPRVRDDRDTPLVWDETAAVIEVIWVGAEQQNFLLWDSTAAITPNLARRAVDFFTRRRHRGANERI